MLSGFAHIMLEKVMMMVMVLMPFVFFMLPSPIMIGAWARVVGVKTRWRHVAWAIIRIGICG